MIGGPLAVEAGSGARQRDVDIAGQRRQTGVWHGVDQPPRCGVGHREALGNAGLGPARHERALRCLVRPRGSAARGAGR